MSLPDEVEGVRKITAELEAESAAMLQLPRESRERFRRSIPWWHKLDQVRAQIADLMAEVERQQDDEDDDEEP